MTSESTHHRAITDILAERRRQVREEGFDAARDDAYISMELSSAAVCYAIHHENAGAWRQRIVRMVWPWAWSWWKPRDYRTNLVRAGALIVAEIERLDRRTSP